MGEGQGLKGEQNRLCWSQQGLLGAGSSWLLGVMAGTLSLLQLE